MAEQFLDAAGLNYYHKGLSDTLDASYMPLIDNDKAYGVMPVRTQQQYLDNDTHRNHELVATIKLNGTGYKVQGTQILKTATPERVDVDYNFITISDIYLHDESKINAAYLTSIANLAKLAEFIDYYPGSLEGEVGGIEYDSNDTPLYTAIYFYYVKDVHTKRFVAAGHGKLPNEAWANGPEVGICTTSNYFTKWKNGDINIDSNGAKTYNTYALEYAKYLFNKYAYIAQSDTSGNYSEWLNMQFTTSQSAISKVMEINEAIPGFSTFHTLGSEEENGVIYYYILNRNPSIGFHFPITNVLDNGEVSMTNLAVLNTSGQLIVNDGSKSFHTVNKRQLDSIIPTALSPYNEKKGTGLVTHAIDTAINSVMSSIDQAIEQGISEFRQFPELHRLSLAAGEDGKRGWYTIATKKVSGSYISGIFKLTVKTNGTTATELIFAVSRANARNVPTLTILTECQDSYAAIDAVRVVYTTTNTGSDTAIEVHLSEDAVADSSKHRFEIINLLDTTAKWDYTNLTRNDKTDIETVERSLSSALSNQPNTLTITEDKFNKLTTKDPNTIYFVYTEE